MEILEKMEKEEIFNELDYKITDLEVYDAIKSFKIGKASGFSKILNEMLKYGQNVLSPILVSLFNKMLINGYYPKLWSLGYI